MLLLLCLLRPFDQLVRGLFEHDVLALDVLEPGVDLGQVDALLHGFFLGDRHAREGFARDLHLFFADFLDV